jgi:hypothetical protein
MFNYENYLTGIWRANFGVNRMQNTNRYNMKRLDKNLTFTGICYSVCTGIRLMAFVGFGMYR